MNKKQIKGFIDNCSFNDSCSDSSLIETHISWIVLTDHYAYKFKRPVKYSFVDFSSRDLREHYCNQEVELNRRLAPDMYLGVFPVTENGVIEETIAKKDNVIDFSVKMKRMDENKRMDFMLREGEVDRNDIEALAEKLAQFHNETRIVKNAFNTLDFQEKFRDILSEEDYIIKHYGNEYMQKVKDAVDQSYLYLNMNRSYMNDRIISSFQRDCHGDLNSTNVFLYEDPVIFDCIDFNKEFRIIDVLNEIAFMSVDLDFHGYSELGELLYQKYMKASGADSNKKTVELYTFYKSYRANVRAKVTAINSKNSNHEDKSDDVKKYLDLMLHYVGEVVDNSNS